MHCRRTSFPLLRLKPNLIYVRLHDRWNRRGTFRGPALPRGPAQWAFAIVASRSGHFMGASCGLWYRPAREEHGQVRRFGAASPVFARTRSQAPEVGTPNHDQTGPGQNDDMFTAIDGGKGGIRVRRGTRPKICSERPLPGVRRVEQHQSARSIDEGKPFSHSCRTARASPSRKTKQLSAAVVCEPFQMGCSHQFTDAAARSRDEAISSSIIWLVS